MQIEECLVFVDLEATGLDPIKDSIIQIAAIAVDCHLNELESIDLKIRFDDADIDPQEIENNICSKALWNHEAIPEKDAAQRFFHFLRRHATFELVSKSGVTYQVAQLVAHNGECFDGPFIHAWYRKLGIFCPARYMVLCTKQRALWLFDEDKSLTPPTDFKLGTLCEYFGVRLRAEDAHDAFNDVRATVELYREMGARKTTLQNYKNLGARIHANQSV